MTLGDCFWLLFLIALVIGHVPAVRSRTPAWSGGLIDLLMWLAIGWAVFGPPIHG